MKQLCISTFILFSVFQQATAQRGQIKDAVHQKYEDEQGPEGTGALNQWLYGNLMNVKVAPAYSFPMSLKMHLTDYKNGQVKSESDLQHFINSEKQLFATDMSGYQKSKAAHFSIYDYAQNAFIVMDKDKKTIMAFTLNAFMSKATQDKMKSGETMAEKSNGVECKKTGKTKQIKGYKCEEYICTNEAKNTRTEMWVASALFSKEVLSSLKLPMFSSLTNMPSGMILEATTFKNNQPENKLEVTDINTKANFTQSTEGYSVNGK